MAKIMNHLRDASLVAEAHYHKGFLRLHLAKYIAVNIKSSRPSHTCFPKTKKRSAKDPHFFIQIIVNAADNVVVRDHFYIIKIIGSVTFYVSVVAKITRVVC